MELYNYHPSYPVLHSNIAGTEYLTTPRYDHSNLLRNLTTQSHLATRTPNKLLHNHWRPSCLKVTVILLRFCIDNAASFTKQTRLYFIKASQLAHTRTPLTPSGTTCSISLRILSWQSGFVAKLYIRKLNVLAVVSYPARRNSTDCALISRLVRPRVRIKLVLSDLQWEY